LHDRRSPPCGPDTPGSLLGLRARTRVPEADVRATPGQLLGDDETDPLSAGDERDFVSEKHHIQL
jgi:hypothetical protein